jgi:hypothetical protein
MNIYPKNTHQANARIARGSDKDLIDWLLSLNTKNRTLKSKHVAYIRDEIKAGNWRLTNQGIGVTAGGLLTDGQHRLEAIKAADYPDIEFLLVTGLPDDAQNYVDLHVKRTSADLLKLVFDAKIAGRFAASITAWLRGKSGQWGYKFPPSDLISAYEEIGDSIAYVYSHSKAQSLAAPVVAAIADIYKQSGDISIGAFIHQVTCGEMLKAGDPALTLRNFLYSHKGSTGGGNVQKERYFKTRYACTAFLDGRQITRLYSIEN